MSAPAVTAPVVAPAVDSADAQPHTTPSADAPEVKVERPELKKVQQVRNFLANRRAVTLERSNARIEARNAKPEVEAKPEPKPEPKPELKEEPKETPKPEVKADAKPEAKKPEAAPERDGNGRFLSKDKPEPEAKVEAKPEPKPEAKPEPKPEVKVEPKVEAKPEPEVKPSKPGLEEKHARLLLDVKRKDEELVKVRERAKKADDYEALIKRVNGAEIDGEALAKLTGRSFENMVRDLKEKKAQYKPATQLPPQLQAAYDEANQLNAKLRERVEAQEKADRDANEAKTQTETAARRKETEERELAHVREQLEAEADKFPMTAGYKNAPSRILNKFYQIWADNCPKDEAGNPTFDFDKQPALSDVITKVEDLLFEDVHGILSSERVLKRVLQDTKTRELVLKLVGEQETPKPQTPPSPKRREPGNQANVEGPRTLSNKVTQETPVVQEKPQTREELQAWRLEQWQRMRTQGRTGVKGSRKE